MSNEKYVPYEYHFFIERTKRPNVTFVSDTHYHNAYEIYFLISGTRRQLVDHSIHDIKRGDLILIPKGVIHKTTPLDKNSHTRYVINFSDEFAIVGYPNITKNAVPVCRILKQKSCNFFLF